MFSVLFLALGSRLGSLEDDFWFDEVGTIGFVVVLGNSLLFDAREAPV